MSTSDTQQRIDALLAAEARDTGIAFVEAAADDWDRMVIDRAISHVASIGGRFSANDVRPLLPKVRSALIGARFRIAALRGEIVHVGYVKSTDKATHAHPISVWRSALDSSAVRL